MVSKLADLKSVNDPKSFESLEDIQGKVLVEFSLPVQQNAQ